MFSGASPGELVFQANDTIDEAAQYILVLISDGRLN
jgi:hypothetical protein